MIGPTRVMELLEFGEFQGSLELVVCLELEGRA